MQTTLYLIRHGDYNSKDNPTLSEAGVEQAEDIAERLADKDITHIISSPIQRALDTAVPLAERIGLEVEIDEAFTEFFPDKEAFDAALGRIKTGIADVVKKYEGQTVAVYSHGFTVGEFLLAIKYGTPEELPIGSVKSGAFAGIVCENGEYTVGEVYRVTKTSLGL